GGKRRPQRAECARSRDGRGFRSREPPAGRARGHAVSEFVVPREPLPTLGMLLTARTPSRGPDLFEARTSYPTFWARSAIYHGLGLLGLAPGDGVLVPSYHCAAAVEPLLRYGAQARFYGIRRD